MQAPVSIDLSSLDRQATRGQSLQLSVSWGEIARGTPQSRTSRFTSGSTSHCSSILSNILTTLYPRQFTAAIPVAHALPTSDTRSPLSPRLEEQSILEHYYEVTWSVKCVGKFSEICVYRRRNPGCYHTQYSTRRWASPIGLDLFPSVLGREIWCEGSCTNVLFARQLVNSFRAVLVSSLALRRFN